MLRSGTPFETGKWKSRDTVSGAERAVGYRGITRIILSPYP